MQKANKFGSYFAEVEEELGRVGRAFVSIGLCQCEGDGLHRYTLALQYSYGGFRGPISADAPGFTSVQAAKAAGVMAILASLATMQGNGDPESAQKEVRELRSRIEANFRQPSLF